MINVRLCQLPTLWQLALISRLRGISKKSKGVPMFIKNPYRHGRGPNLPPLHSYA